MAVTYTNAVKTNRMSATRDHFANGTLEIGTTGFATILCTFNLSPAGGTVATDTWTVQFDAGNNTSSVSATGSGTAVTARLKTNGGIIDLSGLTVGTSGTDIVLDNNVIALGQTIQINGATIQHA